MTRTRWWRSFWGHDVLSQHPFDNADNYYPYPNPHLRTTAFMVPPRLLERIFHWPQSESIHTKDHEHLFETGKFSLTAQALLAGFEPLVVGADGCSYVVALWPQSRTFMCREQTNLIIDDHLSRSFENSPPDGKILWTGLMYNQKEYLNQYFEQVMSSDTSQIEAHFLKAANQKNTIN